MKNKKLLLIFDERTFRKLSNKKEVAKINKEISTWEEWILKLAKIK